MSWSCMSFYLEGDEQADDIVAHLNGSAVVVSKPETCEDTL